MEQTTKEIIKKPRKKRYCKPGEKYYNYRTRKCKKCLRCEDGYYADKTTDLRIGENGATQCYKCKECGEGRYSNSETVRNGYKECRDHIKCQDSNRMYSNEPNSTYRGDCGDCIPCTYPTISLLMDSFCAPCSQESADKTECSHCDKRSKETSTSSPVQPLLWSNNTDFNGLATTPAGWISSSSSTTHSTVFPVTLSLMAAEVIGIVFVVIFTVWWLKKKYNNQPCEPASAFSSQSSSVSSSNLEQVKNSNKNTTLSLPEIPLIVDNDEAADEESGILLTVVDLTKHGDETSHLLPHGEKVETDGGNKLLKDELSEWNELKARENLKFIKGKIEAIASQMQENIVEKHVLFVPRRLMEYKKEYFQSILPNRSDLEQKYDLDDEYERSQYFCEWLHSKNPTYNELCQSLIAFYERYNSSNFLEVLSVLVDLLEKHSNENSST